MMFDFSQQSSFHVFNECNLAILCSLDRYFKNLIFNFYPFSSTTGSAVIFSPLLENKIRTEERK